MLSKCANPKCNAVFRRLGQGRLFEANFDDAMRRRRSGSADAALQMRKEPKSVEHFWLCDECAQHMTIGLNSHTNRVVLVPDLYGGGEELQRIAAS
jgi:hypothetical protein